jgi:hypothetical protein
MTATVDGNGKEKINVSDWRTNIKTWFWKLVFTLISAKVLITAAMISLTYGLAVVQRPVEVLRDDGSIDIFHTPYLSGEQLVALWGTIITVFMGARVMVPAINAVTTGVTNALLAKNGNGHDDVDDSDYEPSEDEEPEGA